AGTKNIRSDNGDRSLYAITSTVTRGAYNGTDETIIGASLRMSSHGLLVPRTCAAIAANTTSRISATTAPASVATAVRTNSPLDSLRQYEAASPVSAPLMARLLV